MNNRQLSQTQTGFITFPMMCTIAFLGLMVVFSLKIGPAYLDHQTLTSVVKGALTTASEGKRPSRKAVRKLINNGLMTNRLEFLTTNNVIIERGKSTMTVTLDYERRMPLLLNIDAVLKFEEQTFESQIKE